MLKLVLCEALAISILHLCYLLVDPYNNLSMVVPIDILFKMVVEQKHGGPQHATIARGFTSALLRHCPIMFDYMEATVAAALACLWRHRL
jgi:hypothetical protein